MSTAVVTVIDIDAVHPVFVYAQFKGAVFLRLHIGSAAALLAVGLHTGIVDGFALAVGDFP